MNQIKINYSKTIGLEEASHEITLPYIEDENGLCTFRITREAMTDLIALGNSRGMKIKEGI